MYEMDPRLRTRLLNLAAEARDALSRPEMARRERWCLDNADDTLIYRRDGADVVGVWGGAELVRVDEELLRGMSTDDELTAVLAAAPTVPDDVSELTGR